MSRPLAVLIVEDSDDDTFLLLRELGRGGYDVRHERVQTAEAMEEALRREHWDLVVSDCVMPMFSGGGALEVLRASGLDLPFIMMSGALREEDAVDALRAGAHDFVVKGRLARLLPAIERELREAEVRRCHREAQARLNRSEKLVVLGQLAAGIAHDLRNIFTPLQLLAGLLRQRAGPDPLGLAIFDKIDQMLQVGIEVIGRLDLFRDRGDPADAEPLALAVVARSAVELGRYRTRSLTGVRLEMEEVDAAPPVRVPRGELTSALLNVIVNALDAIGEAGVVRVRAGAAEAGAYVEVVDDGPGMTPEVQRRVLEPFFTTKVGGTGLGLSIVCTFVERHGGRLTIDTGAEKGTCVRMWFPGASAAVRVA